MKSLIILSLLGLTGCVAVDGAYVRSDSYYGVSGVYVEETYTRPSVTYSEYRVAPSPHWNPYLGMYEIY